MIPTRFDYEAPETLDAAIRILHENGDEAKPLAGGHSLIPLMKMRLAAPAVLVDLRKVPGLHSLQSANGAGTRIGAMVTHARVADTPELGVAAHAAGLIADQQVRNRGTIGGSLAHGDSASDMPSVLVAAEGSVVAQGPGGTREIAAADLIEGYLTTSLEPDELVVEVLIPSLEGFGWGYEKFTRRAEDWAMVGVCALVRDQDGSAADVRIGMSNMAPTPIRATAAEAALRGQPLTAETIATAAEAAAEGTDPPGDLNATPEYKQHLARVLTRRALAQAAGLG